MQIISLYRTWQSVCTVVGGVEGQPSSGAQDFTPRSVVPLVGTVCLASLTLEVLLCVYKAGVLVFRDTED